MTAGALVIELSVGFGNREAELMAKDIERAITMEREDAGLVWSAERRKRWKWWIIYWRKEDELKEDRVKRESE